MRFFNSNPQFVLSKLTVAVNNSDMVVIGRPPYTPRVCGH
jgi:hypothetical protein